MKLKLLSIFILYSTNLFSAEAKSDSEAKVEVTSDPYYLFKQDVISGKSTYEVSERLIEEDKIDIEYQYQGYVHVDGNNFHNPTPLILAIVFKRAGLVSKFLKKNPKVTVNLDSAFKIAKELKQTGNQYYTTIYETFSRQFATQTYLCGCGRFFCCNYECCNKYCCECCVNCCYKNCGEGSLCEKCCYYNCANAFQCRINGESQFTNFSKAVKKCFGCGQ